MSVIRPRPPEEPLAYAVAAGPLVAPAEADASAAELAAVRDALVAEPAGTDLASRLLADYDTRRPASELFAILGRARTLRDAVDRLVVVADGGIGPATRLLVATCCHPFHDQLSRGERGGRPRISWLDGSAGNDEVQGLLDLLGRDPHGADDLLDRWGLIVADGSAAAPVAAILRDWLEAAGGGDRRLLADRLVSLDAGPTTDDGRRRSDGAVAHGAEVFTAAGLLPAAIAGIDVVRLLKGAAALGRRFAEAPVAENPPLLDAAAARAAATAGRPGRLFAGSGRWLGELSAWHGCLRPAPPGAAALVTLLGPGEPRRDRLPGLPAGGGGPAVAADVWIGLPRLDEHAVGQLLQLLVLSAAVERRLRPAV